MVDGLQIDTFHYLRPGCRKIAFLGQSALSKENMTKGLPFFFRNSWVEELSCSTVIFNDPTLYLYRKLAAGWSQGSPAQFGIPAMGKVCDSYVAAVAAATGCTTPEISFGFYGSSAGGFWALFMAALYGAPCVIETPQTDMFAYPLEPPREELFDRCYRDHGLDPAEYRHRLRAVDWFDHLGRHPARIDYYQSDRDHGHIETQLRPFEAAMAGRPCPLKVGYYKRAEDKMAHGPMGKKASLAAIHSLFD